MTSQLVDNTDNSVDLPENWEMRVDPKTGMPYYLNHLKQFTTWDDPRVVQDPRGMLNNMGTMIRQQQRSISPSPTSSRIKTNEDGSTTIPFNHVLAPTEAEFNQQTRSLPRSRRQHQQKFNRGWMDDDSWFKARCNDPMNDSDFPFPGRSLRVRSQSPFANATVDRARGGMPPRRGSSVRQQQASISEPQPVSIPVTSERDGPCVQEYVIIPTRYRRDTDGGPLEQTLPKCRESPTPKQAKQEADSTTSCEDECSQHEALQRNDSVYDNNLAADESLTTKTTDINDNEERSLTPEAELKHAEADSTSIDSDKSDHTDADVDTNNDHKASDEHEDETSEEKILRAKIDESYKAIDKVREEIASYKKDVEEFSSDKQCKQYRYLDEMLTRCQLKLDNIETHGDLELRKHRKETVNNIDSLLMSLEQQCQPVS